jgi:DNA primase
VAIADDDIERVRAATSLTAVVSHYLSLRRVGRNQVGLCPFHAEKSGSFNVREEIGRYRCFGCGASGDVFTFVQNMEHLDFVGAVEHLAAKAGISLTYTSGTQQRDRQKGKELVAVVERAVEWYHDRLLNSPDARAARDYLRSRGLAGDAARQFKIGWAPDDWDALSKALKVSPDTMREAGLGFTNSRGRQQDTFRARVMFPIFKESGEAVGFGGRVLPGSTDPAKYKNSPESTVYTKSRTLYGLNWAKADVVKLDQIVVCEGYTDVIGFHRVGIHHAVATCGTALTEDHVRLMKRFTSRIVLAFDADAAGQGAAERFYEWERKFDVQVAVARLAGGKDPGELADSDPDALRRAVAEPEPFLAFRLRRVLEAGSTTTPEAAARAARAAMTVINEHPDVHVRKLYAGQVATHVGIPVADIMADVAPQRQAPLTRAQAPLTASTATSSTASSDARDEASGEEAVLAHLLVDPSLDEFLSEYLFTGVVHRQAFASIRAARGDVTAALRSVDERAAAVIERVSVADPVGDPIVEIVNLVRAAVRRSLAVRGRHVDAETIKADRAVKQAVERLGDPAVAVSELPELLTWLNAVNENGADPTSGG